MKPLIAYFLILVSILAEVRCDPPASESEKLPAGIANEDTPPTAIEKPMVLEKATIYSSGRFDDQLRELRKLYQPKPPPPFLENGRMFRKQFGGKEIEIGAEKNNDIFKERAKYQDKTPMVKIDVLRLRF